MLKALVIEDDKSFAKLVELRLRAWKPDIKLSFADCLDSARNKLDAGEIFDFVVLDQNLPDGMGFELASHPGLQESTILAVSSDESPELPAQTVRAGAQHFLNKRHVSTPLFLPLLEALLERRTMSQQLREAELRAVKLKTLKRLIATLRHEINNPLGAVFGAAYLLKDGTVSSSQAEALKLIEKSGTRIKTVIEQLSAAADLEEVTKADEEVYQIPGDAPWPEGTPSTPRRRKKTTRIK